MSPRHPTDDPMGWLDRATIRDLDDVALAPDVPILLILRRAHPDDPGLGAPVALRVGTMTHLFDDAEPFHAKTRVHFEDLAVGPCIAPLQGVPSRQYVGLQIGNGPDATRIVARQFSWATIGPNDPLPTAPPPEITP